MSRWSTILYTFALTDSGRVIGDTTAAATEAAATAAEELDSVGGAPPTESAIGALWRGRHKRANSCGRHRAAAAAALGRIPEQLRVTLGPELCRMQ